MSIQLEMHDGVALITMDDGKANAMGYDNFTALTAALNEAEKTAKAVVLAGRDGVFTGGFDLKVVQGGSPEALYDLMQVGARACLRMFTFPKPLVMASTGHAVALGAVIMMTADHRFGRSGPYNYVLNETALGMTLPAFGMEPVRSRMPATYFTRAVLQSEIFDTETALAAGYIDALTDDPVAAAVEHAAKLAQLPQPVYAETKMLLRRATIQHMEDWLENPVF